MTFGIPTAEFSLLCSIAVLVLVIAARPYVKVRRK